MSDDLHPRAEVVCTSQLSFEPPVYPPSQTHLSRERSHQPATRRPLSQTQPPTRPLTQPLTSPHHTLPLRQKAISNTWLEPWNLPTACCPPSTRRCDHAAALTQRLQAIPDSAPAGGMPSRCRGASCFTTAGVQCISTPTLGILRVLDCRTPCPSLLSRATTWSC